MKPIALMSIGLLGSAVAAAGVTGYLAWNNLAGANLKSNQVTASVTNKPPTQPPSPQPIAAPTEAAYTPPSAPSVPALSQAENDFLFDLTQALQPAEHDRLSNAERLAMAQQITEWLKAGTDYWDLRSKFDQAYQNQIAGDYAFNREVYLKFTVERFAPDAWIALAPPRSQPSRSPDWNAPDSYEPPYEPPYEESYEPPYQPPYEESYEPPYEEPPIGIPAPHPAPPPYAQPPYPYPPVARPPFPPPYPDWEPAPYPQPMPQPPIAQRPPYPQPPFPQPPIPQPAPQQPPADNPDWYQNPDAPSAPPSPQPPSRDPNVTEILAPSNPAP